MRPRLFVAFTTIAMEPVIGWLDALIDETERSGAAGVGGSIAPAVGLSATDRAVFLLRYVNYLPPLPTSGIEPPGENAFYRVDCLRGLDDFMDDGFWETEIHHALRRRGDSLSMTVAATALYRGSAHLLPTALERFRHGRIYGASRASRMSVGERLVRLMIAPLVPTVLGLRVWRRLRARGESIRTWWSAVPAFAALALAWTIGEAVGFLWQPDRGRHSAKTSVVERTQLTNITRPTLYDTTKKEQGAIS